MVKHDDEATVDLGRLNQTWKSRRGCPGRPGRPARSGGLSGSLEAGEDARTTIVIGSGQRLTLHQSRGS